VRTPGLSGAMLPAIRDGSSLNQALDLGYRQVLVERGSLLAMLGPLVSAARQGIAIFVNLDGVEGLAGDSAALAFLATDLGFSGVLSVKPHLLRDASRFRLRTVQRIHALDSTGLETGLNSIVSPAPYAIAMAPALSPRPPRRRRFYWPVPTSLPARAPTSGSTSSVFPFAVDTSGHLCYDTPAATGGTLKGKVLTYALRMERAG